MWPVHRLPRNEGRRRTPQLGNSEAILTLGTHILNTRLEPPIHNDSTWLGVRLYTALHLERTPVCAQMSIIITIAIVLHSHSTMLLRSLDASHSHLNYHPQEQSRERGQQTGELLVPHVQMPSAVAAVAETHHGVNTPHTQFVWWERAALPTVLVAYTW